MAKISVELDAFYGYSCGFQSHGSNKTVEIEVSDNELEALKKFGKKEITAEDIVAAIEAGDTTLESLHEQLSEKFYYMVEEYWLYEAYNEFLEESLENSKDKDIKTGLYTPPSLEDVVEKVKSREINLRTLRFCVDTTLVLWEKLKDKLESFKDINESDFYNWEGDPDIEYKYNRYILNHYYDWLCEHDHEFVAERVGLDLDACRDDEVNYTISLPND